MEFAAEGVVVDLEVAAERACHPGQAAGDLTGGDAGLVVGEAPEAADRLEQADEVQARHRGVHHAQGQAQYLLLGALAGHAAGEGGFRRAARLQGAAGSLQTGVGASDLPYLAPWVDKARRSAIAALGKAAFKTEFEAGQRLDRREALALALGEPAPAAFLAADREAGSLGERQMQVARLIADGLSNKQIATRLLISRHTVDTHVRNIMTRLGCGSRAQIAAWVASSTSDPGL